jgi:hypothetical protein
LAAVATVPPCAAAVMAFSNAICNAVNAAMVTGSVGKSGLVLRQAITRMAKLFNWSFGKVANESATLMVFFIPHFVPLWKKTAGA